jgi:hypothetical protein
MAECAFCKVETELHESGLPICPACASARDGRLKGTQQKVHSILHHELQAAAERAKAATASFDAASREIPSGLPEPDGTQRIHNASREVSLARVDLMRAHNRLNDYVGRGIVPEDLKRHG